VIVRSSKQTEYGAENDVVQGDWRVGGEESPPEVDYAPEHEG